MATIAERNAGSPARMLPSSHSGKQREIIIINDSSDEDTPRRRRPPMPPKHPRPESDDDEPVFMGGSLNSKPLSSFRAISPSGSILVKNSPLPDPQPVHQQDAAPMTIATSPPLLKKAKTETRLEGDSSAPVPVPEDDWVRFWTLTVSSYQKPQNSGQLEVGDRVFFRPDPSLPHKIEVFNGADQVVGQIAPGYAYTLAAHMRCGDVQLEGYALKLRAHDFDALTFSVDLMCQGHRRREFFSKFKSVGAVGRSVEEESLPEKAAIQAAAAKDALVSGSSGGVAAPGLVSAAQSTATTLWDDFQAAVLNAQTAANRSIQRMPRPYRGDDHNVDELFAPFRGFDEYDFQESAVPQEDDEDEDQPGSQEEVNHEQKDVVARLAKSNYQGRNALGALYDENATLDVATLPIYPGLEKLQQNGLKATLHHHQSQGLAWMVRAEHPQLPRRRADGFVMLWRAVRQKSGTARYNHLAKPGEWHREPPRLPRGGILSDDMGLGKTLQIIALCLSDPTGQKLIHKDRKEADKEEADWLEKLKNKGKKKAEDSATKSASSTKPAVATRASKLQVKGEADASQTKAEVIAKLEDSDETATEPEEDVPEEIVDPLDTSFTKTTLVVCPLSVVYNWVKQLEQHTDNTKVKFAVYHGDQIKKMAHQRWSQYDFIITTYDVLKSEFRPIDKARRAREQAELREQKIEDLQRDLDHIREGILGPMDPGPTQRQLEDLRRTHAQELADYSAGRKPDKKGGIEQVLAKGKSSKGAKGKAAAKRSQLEDSDFEWSPEPGSSTSTKRAAKAPRKSAPKTLKDEVENFSSSSDIKVANGVKSDPDDGDFKPEVDELDSTSESNDEMIYDFDELFAYEKPKILKAKFRRLVMDEAHVGRNSKTLVHHALLEVQAERRWCVTGTPLINTTMDLQSLCAFLHVEHLQDPKMWRNVIEKAIRQGSSELGAKLLKTIIFCTTLRRTKDMQGPDGKPLVQLPPITMYKNTVELDPDTRQYYDRVSEIMRGRVQGLWQEGELANQYANVLMFLCRLRQICCSRDLVPANYLDQLQDLVAQPANLENVQPVKELDAKKIKELQERLRAFITTGAEECPICMDIFKDPRITPCSHVFCLQCITDAIQAQAKCPLDRHPLPAGSPLVEMPPEEQFRDDLKDEDDASTETDAASTKETSPVAEGNITPEEAEARVQSVKIDQLVEVLKATERNGTSAETEGVKSLVFSNFVGFHNKVADRLKREGIPYCRFDGSLNKKKRERVLRSFERPIPPGQTSMPADQPAPTRTAGRSRTLIEMLDERYASNSSPASSFRALASVRRSVIRAAEAEARDEEGVGQTVPRVMLISIQAGALGLNLTAASQVFILDPWWQGQIEAQAIDRVHRIGQARPVKVFQFVCCNTVEERVMEIQKEKEELIKNSFSGIKNRGMSIETSREKKDATIRDILRIFGIGTTGDATNNAGSSSSMAV